MIKEGKKRPPFIELTRVINNGRRCTLALNYAFPEDETSALKNKSRLHGRHLLDVISCVSGELTILVEGAGMSQRQLTFMAAIC
jgi:hypothetical protein